MASKDNNKEAKNKPRGKKPTKPNSPAIKKEIIYLIVLCVGLVFTLAVFAGGAVGNFGYWFRNILLGLFGFGGVVLPIGVVAYAVLSLMSREVSFPLKRSIALFWLILGLLYIIVPPLGENYYSGMGYLSAVYRSNRLLSGGLMGAILGSLFVAVATRVVAGIIFAIAIICLVVNITDKSFVQIIGKGANKAKDYYAEKRYRDYDDEDDGDDYEEDVAEAPAPKRVEPKRPEPKRSEPRRPAPADPKLQRLQKPRTVIGPKGKGQAAHRPRPLVPLEKRIETRKPGEKSPLINFGHETTGEAGDFTVRLIQEEIEGSASDDTKVALPKFLRQDVESRREAREEKYPKILRFSGQAEAGAEASAAETMVATLDDDFVIEADIFEDEDYVAFPETMDVVEPDFEGADEYLADEYIAGEYLREAEDEDDEETEAVEAIPSIEAAPVDFVYTPAPETTASDLYQREDFSKPEPELEPDTHITVRGLAKPAPPASPVAKAAPAPAQPAQPTYENYILPPITILSKKENQAMSMESEVQVRANARKLEETLQSFRIEAKVVEVSVGPTVTRYDLAPGPGVKVSSIANLSNDLALSLAAQGIRIEAPIPGKSAVGIEIPNKEPQGVFLREILESEGFAKFSSKLAFGVGKDIAGAPVVTDVADMPHLLIAGATGAGKSVCINTLIASLLYKARPDEVKLLMIDPKVVELSIYNGIPHLLIPVVTDPKKASGALNWAVQEMEARYANFAETSCRDLKGYNRHIQASGGDTLPQIVIIIDELADLMMTCKGEVEEAICRLAQKARAAGIHLIVATQRPSVDVITGLIKANIPSRLAFAVSSGTDSRTVLDMQGAEKLLGRGDMLFLPRGQNKPIRVQGGFISDKEVEDLVTFLKAQAPTDHTTEMIQQITMPGKANIEGEVDEFFHDAIEFLLVKGKASTSMLQRQFRIGYNRASRLMDDLEMRGIVGPEDGVKPRKVTITREEYTEIYGDR